MVIGQQKNSKNNRRDLTMEEKDDKKPTFTASRPYVPHQYDEVERARLQAVLEKIAVKKLFRRDDFIDRV